MSYLQPKLETLKIYSARVNNALHLMGSHSKTLHCKVSYLNNLGILTFYLHYFDFLTSQQIVEPLLFNLIRRGGCVENLVHLPCGAVAVNLKRH